MEVYENAPVTYEYKTVAAPGEREALYRDTYRSFGWIVEPGSASPTGPVAAPNGGERTLKMKRDRRIAQREQVTELQRRCEAALRDIDKLERSKSSKARIAAFTLGVVGCAFMALSVFSYLAGNLVAMTVFAVPGVLCWAAPYFVHRELLASSERSLAPRIDAQYDIVYGTSEQAATLLRSA